jgi:hypothetical protein
VKLVDQWQQLEQGLPEDWGEARLALRTESPEDFPRAAAVLGPLGAGRRGNTLVFAVRRAGGQAGPEAARRLFRTLDESRAWAELDLLEVHGAEQATVREVTPPAPLALSASWDAALATLPDDWSDLLCELDLDSSDHLDRAALLCAPLNPTRDPSKLAFVFRCARKAGYGVSPGMARRCLERCDREGITGRVTVLRVLSETDNVATQGAVWYVGGRVL